MSNYRPGTIGRTSNDLTGISTSVKIAPTYNPAPLAEVKAAAVEH